MFVQCTVLHCTMYNAKDNDVFSRSFSVSLGHLVMNDYDEYEFSVTQTCVQVSLGPLSV